MNDQQLRVYSINPMYRFQFEEAQQCHVLLYPEGMIQLNEMASAILGLCDGQRTVDQVVQQLENEYAGENIREDVELFLDEAYEKQWIQIQPR